MKNTQNALKRYGGAVFLKQAAKKGNYCRVVFSTVCSDGHGSFFEINSHQLGKMKTFDVEHKMMMIGLHHAQLTSIDSVQSNIFEFKKAPTLSDEVNKLRNDLLCLNDIPVQKYIISSTKNYANILKQPIFEDKDTYLLTSNPEPKTIDPFIITPHSFRYLDIECCYQNDTSRVPSVFQGVGLSVEEGLEYLCLTGEKWAESYFVKSSSTENKPVTFRVCVDLGANVNARLINTGQIDQIILNVWLGGNSREFEKSLFITESDLFRNFDIAHQHTYVSYF